MNKIAISDGVETDARGVVGSETKVSTSKSYKWLLVAMLSCAFFFHQADRALFGLLTIPIQKDLGLTDVQIGWINSVLSWTLAGMAFIAGPVGDRFSRKWIITIGFQFVAMLCGAPCLVAIGLMPSAAAMIVMTAAYGVFRGFFEVNTHATLFDVIPAQYRSTSVGIFTVFAFLFGGLSGVMMGALSQKYGVRGFEIGFVLMGAAYVIGALFVMYGFCFTFKKDRVVEHTAVGS